MQLFTAIAKVRMIGGDDPRRLFTTSLYQVERSMYLNLEEEYSRWKEKVINAVKTALTQQKETLKIVEELFVDNDWLKTEWADPVQNSISCLFQISTS